MAKKKVTKDLYGSILEEMTSTEKYQELLSAYAEMKEDFEKDLTEEQKKQLLVLSDLSVDMNEELNFQVFCEGFGLAVKLMNEVYYKEENN